MKYKEEISYSFKELKNNETKWDYLCRLINESARTNEVDAYE